MYRVTVRVSCGFLNGRRSDFSTNNGFPTECCSTCGEIDWMLGCTDAASILGFSFCDCCFLLYTFLMTAVLMDSVMMLSDLSEGKYKYPDTLTYFITKIYSKDNYIIVMKYIFQSQSSVSYHIWSAWRDYKMLKDIQSLLRIFRINIVNDLIRFDSIQSKKLSIRFDSKINLIILIQELNWIDLKSILIQYILNQFELNLFDSI